MATVKEAIRATELAGTRIDKQKLIAAIKRAAEKNSRLPETLQDMRW